MAAFVKKYCMSVAALLVAVMAAVVCSCIHPAVAHASEVPTVVYDGSSQTLSIETAEGAATATDLFSNFKALMPGDTRTQQVTFEVRNTSNTVKVSVQASFDSSGYSDAALASLASITLESAGQVDAAGSPGSVFSEPTCVATFNAPGTVTVDLTLNVPTSVGNELADASQEVEWLITVEETESNDASAAGASSDSDQNSASAKTGDETNALAVLAVVACASVVIVMSRRAIR